MTDVPVSQEAVEVAQEAREAAADYQDHARGYKCSAPLRDGRGDGASIVQAFAKFEQTIRQTSTQALEAENAALREENKLLREALDADCTAFPAMEAKLIEVSNRISGVNGGPPCHPDPILLSEWVSEINHAALGERP